jgi:N-acetyl-anhydromuramyl-L-alanine amidase AmpD
MRGSIESVFNDSSGANWAPSSDLNDPDSYLSTMLANMNRLADIDDQWIAATVPPSPPILAKWLPGSHTKGRQGARALAIVMHITQGGSAGSAYNHWLNIANSSNPASAHYIVDRDSLGTIWTCVREADVAWANGILANANLEKALVLRWAAGGINPNRESVSIEVAGYSPQQPNSNPSLNGYTPAQWASLEFLIPSIARRWGLAIDAESVLGHKDIDGVNRANCPGLSAEEWQRVYAMDESAPVPVTDDELLDIRWQEAQEIVGAKVAAALLHRPWAPDGTTKVLRCERGWVGQTDEIEARLVDDTETMLTGAGYLQRL